MLSVFSVIADSSANSMFGSGDIGEVRVAEDLPSVLGPEPPSPGTCPPVRALRWGHKVVVVGCRLGHDWWVPGGLVFESRPVRLNWRRPAC